MKLTKIFSLVLLLVCLFSGKLIAQDINVQNAIGKKLTEIVKKYGNPVHQDKSNPAMVCVFYKSGNSTMSFVSNDNGVYQAETNQSFNTEKEARADIDECISSAISKGFVCDTVSINDFQLTKPGVRSSIQINANKITKKIDVHAKAVKTEG